MKKAVAWVRVVVGQIIVGIFLFSYFGILKAPPQGWPTKETRANETTGTMTTKERFKHVLMLWPYMIPLFIVYFAEYLIQAGAWTSYSFDPSQVSIPENRDEAYLWLNFLYQWGVFISRSSTILFVLNRTALWIMPFLQIGMLLLFSFNATHQFWNGLSLLVPAFITGLLGGGVYVNAFTLISKEVEQAYVEFSLSAASVADTLGIIGGDILAMFLQGCIYQQLGFANQADVTCPFA
jgi:battenin